MKHLAALGIKYGMIAVVLFLLWPLVGVASPLMRLWMAFWVTILTYLIGDMIILPSTGTWIATLLDGGLAALILFFGQVFTTAVQISFLGAIILGALIAVGEWFFHRFVKSAVLSP